MTLLFDGHPGRPEGPVAFERADRIRLEAYPTGYLLGLGRRETEIIAAITKAESQAARDFCKTPTG